MMTLANNRELRLIERSVTEFSKKALKDMPDGYYPDGPDTSVDSLLKKAEELDLFHLLLPESAGGTGMGIRALCIVLESLCLTECSLATMILATAAAVSVVSEAGEGFSEDLVCTGNGSVKDVLTAFPLFFNPVEEELSLTAVPEGAGYRLSGSLEYLVGAGLAEKAMVPAKIRDQNGFAYFMVRLDHPGISMSGPVKGLGLKACPSADLTLDAVDGAVCCLPGDGRRCFEAMASLLSPGVAAMETGIMKGSFKEAMDYTSNRPQGGRTIIHWSEVKRILSTMALNIQHADMLLQQCCSSIEVNDNGWKAEAATTLIKIPEMACDVTSDGIRVMGGVGYMKDFGQEKRFRDSRHLMSVFGIVHLKKLGFLDAHVTGKAS